MARRYNRDSRGRFASGGGGGGSRRPAARGISRGTNRLTRDNSGRITSVGGDGATARGGRLRTASGKQRGRVTANVGAADRMSSTPKGTIGKTRKQREITMIDRPQAKRAAYNAGRVQQQAAIASRKTKPDSAAATKPTRKSIGSIDEAKASRIIARLDANRSGIRRATGTARQTANSIRTRERAVAFALAPGARARKKGQSISTNESLQRAVKNASKNRAAKAATSKAAAAAAAKPAKGSAAAQKIEQAKGRTKVLTQSKNALNQQLKSINAQIKQAGPSAGALRLQKLQIQDRLSQLRRDITASKAAARG